MHCLCKFVMSCFVACCVHKQGVIRSYPLSCASYISWAHPYSFSISTFTVFALGVWSFAALINPTVPFFSSASFEPHPSDRVRDYIRFSSKLSIGINCRLQLSLPVSLYVVFSLLKESSSFQQLTTCYLMIIITPYCYYQYCLLFIYLQIFREIDATKASNFRGTLFFVYVTVQARINYNQGVSTDR